MDFMTMILCNFYTPSSLARSTAITGGSTYTRWGRTECQSGAERVYDGFMAGSYFSYGGGDSPGWLCLTYQPSYATEEKPYYRSFVYSTEYATNDEIFPVDTQNYDAPCVICHVPRTAQLMIPGQTQCPNSWTMEYGGYLMTSETEDWRISKDYICVDGQPEVRPASQDNTDGAQLYFAVMGCGKSFLPCGSDGYKDAVALSCVVCTA